MINVFLRTITLLLIPLCTSAQLVENFDRDPWQWQPLWQGDTTQFSITSDSTLRSSGPASSSHLYLSTPNCLLDSAYWEMSFCLDFNPSSTNYLRIYLAADKADLEAAINGYYLQIGEASAPMDSLRIFRQDGSARIEIFSGQYPCALSSTQNCIKVKVERDPAGHWQLYSDCENRGYYLHEGNFFDDTYFSGLSSPADTTYFGPYCRYTTASRANAYSFDYFEIGQLLPDSIPPKINSLVILDSTSLRLSFSEAMTGLSDPANFTILEPAPYTPDSTYYSILNPTTIELHFAQTFLQGDTSSIQISNLTDIAGNNLNDTVLHFLYYQIKPGDILISEFLFDPDPSQGLPDAEFIELTNTTAFQLSIQDWYVADATSEARPLPLVNFAPKQSVILTPAAASSDFSSYGKTVAVDPWPSLNNSGDTIRLYNDEAQLQHEIGYTNDCFGDDERAAGGYSYEMIDLSKPGLGYCNWHFSEHTVGGTPAQPNSVPENPDESAPRLLTAIPFGSPPMDSLLLTFSKGMDSVGLLSPHNFALSEAEADLSGSILSLHLEEIGENCAGSYVNLVARLGEPLETGLHYEIAASDLRDCQGYLITPEAIRFGLSEQPVPGDLAINEILFNPTSGGSDYLEIINLSSKIISTENLFIEEWSASQPDSLLEQTSFARHPFQLFPQNVVATTPNRTWVVSHYPNGKPELIFESGDLPNFPDEEGVVSLVYRTNEDTAQIRLDWLHYKAAWHFSLLESTEGISLERIDPLQPANDQQNWHSALNKGSPGAPNSIEPPQGADTKGEIVLDPPHFSPNGDGFQDLLFVRYNFEAPPRLATVGIWNHNGRLANPIAKNTLISGEGFFRWDGRLRNGSAAPPGIYILLFEVFDLSGAKEQHKMAFTLR